MPDEATIRIQLEGEGEAAQAPVLPPTPTQFPKSPPLTPPGAAAGTVLRPPTPQGRDVGQLATTPETGPQTEESVADMLPLLELRKEAMAFREQLLALHVAMDPTVVKQRVAQEHELAEAREAVAKAMKAEREQFQQGKAPMDVLPLVELRKEAEAFAAQLAALHAALDPTVVKQRVAQEHELAEAREAVAKAMKAEREQHQDLREVLLKKEMQAYQEQLHLLNLAMDPAVVQQRVKQEVALAEAREAVARAVKAERERQKPLSVTEQLAPLRNQLGAMFGPLAGIFLDFFGVLRNLTQALGSKVATVLPATAADIQQAGAVPLVGVARPTPSLPEAPANARSLPDNAAPLGAGKAPLPSLPPSPQGGVPTPTTTRGLPSVVGESAAMAARGTLPSSVGGVAKPMLSGASAAVAGEATAGGAGMMAGALPGVGIAVAAIAVVAALKDALTGAVAAVGNFSAAMIAANPDPSQFVDTMGSAVKGVSDKLFYLNPALGMFGSVIGSAVSAVGDMMKAMDAMVDRFAGFSPQLASAQAMADVQQVMNDFRRARQVTPQLLEYLQNRTEMQQKFEDAKMRMLDKLMPMTIKGMELAEKLLPLMEVAVDMISLIADMIPGLGGKVDAIKRKMDEEKIEVDLFPTDIIMGPQGANFPFARPNERGGPAPPPILGV